MAARLVVALTATSAVSCSGRCYTAYVGTWTKGTRFSNQWSASGKAISGATKSTFKLTSAQRGKTITVRVTGKLTGYQTVSRTSKATVKIT